MTVLLGHSGCKIGNFYTELSNLITLYSLQNGNSVDKHILCKYFYCSEICRITIQ